MSCWTAFKMWAHHLLASQKLLGQDRCQAPEHVCPGIHYNGLYQQHTSRQCWPTRAEETFAQTALLQRRSVFISHASLKALRWYSALAASNASREIPAGLLQSKRLGSSPWSWCQGRQVLQLTGSTP